MLKRRSLLLSSGVAPILRLWSPLDLGANIIAWWDAYNGASPSQLNDLSGNTFHATQGNGTFQPTYSTTGFPGGKPAITPDGVNDRMSFNGPSYDGTAGWSVIAVAKRSAAATIRTIMSGDNLGSGQFRIEADHKLSIARSGQALIFSGTIVASAAAHVLGWEAKDGYVGCWVDGAGDTGVATPGFSSANNSLFTSLGASEFFDDAVGEIIFSAVLSTLNRQKLEGYLAWKWGLQASLTGVHPYVGGPP